MFLHCQWLAITFILHVVLIEFHQQYLILAYCSRQPLIPTDGNPSDGGNRGPTAVIPTDGGNPSDGGNPGDGGNPSDGGNPTDGGDSGNPSDGGNPRPSGCT